jgi:hypothetical protein
MLCNLRKHNTTYTIQIQTLNGSYQIGLYSRNGSAHLVRAPQALETQQHGENALEFTI